MFKKLSISILLATLCISQGSALAGGTIVDGKLVGGRDNRPKSTGTLPAAGSISYFNEGGYVASYELSYLLNGQWKKKTGSLPVGQTFHSFLDPNATNISFKADGVAVLDPLDMRLSFSRGENVQNCYKSWGSSFWTEWAKVSC